MIQIISEKKEKNLRGTLVIGLLFALLFWAEILSPVFHAISSGSHAVEMVSGIPSAIASLIIVIGSALLFYFLEKRDRKVWMIAGAGIILSAVLALVFRKLVKTGWLVYWNSILFNWNEKEGSIVYYNDYNGMNATLSLFVFEVLIILFLTSLIILLVYYDRRIELLLLAFCFFGAIVFMNPESSVWAGIATGFIMLVFIIWSGTTQKGFLGWRAVCLTAGVAVAAVAVVIAAATFILPSTVLDNGQQKLVDAIEEACFGKPDLTNGDLKRAKQKETSEDSRLMVYVIADDAKEHVPEEESNHQIYLRGFTGSRYTGAKWTDLDKAAYQGKHLAMMQWLTEKENDSAYQFLPAESVASSLAMANHYMEQEGGKQPLYPIRQFHYQIENSGASSRYLYLPISFVDAKLEGNQLLQAEQMNKDINVKNRIFNRITDYSADTLEMAMDEYMELTGSDLFTNEQYIKENEYYLLREQNYSDFVDAYYNDLPDAVVDYLDQDATLKKDSALGVYGIIWNIREYLEGKMTYVETPKSTYGTLSAVSDDYAVNLLKKDKEGYCVQYATIATLLFRYCGIPARYVEGYRIEDPSSAALQGGAGYSVTAKDAHAWVEIYRYGFGWIPVEVTPGYYMIPEDRMLLTSGSQELEQESGEQEPANLEAVTEDVQKEKMEHLWIVILIIILLLILLMLCRYYLIVSRRKKKTHSGNYREDIREMAGLIIRNARLAECDLRHDFPKEAADMMDSFTADETNVTYEDTADAVAHAFYSKEGATAKDAATVESYLQATVTALYGPAGFFKRLKLKYIDVV